MSARLFVQQDKRFPPEIVRLTAELRTEWGDLLVGATSSNIDVIGAALEDALKERLPHHRPQDGRLILTVYGPGNAFVADLLDDNVDVVKLLALLRAAGPPEREE